MSARAGQPWSHTAGSPQTASVRAAAQAGGLWPCCHSGGRVATSSKTRRACGPPPPGDCPVSTAIGAPPRPRSAVLPRAADGSLITSESFLPPSYRALLDVQTGGWNEMCGLLPTKTALSAIARELIPLWGGIGEDTATVCLV